MSESQKFGSRIDAVLLRGASSDSTFSAVSLFARDLQGNGPGVRERCRFCKDRGWLLPHPSVFADAATVFEEEEVRPVALADAAAFSTDAEAVRARWRFFLLPFRLRQSDFELSALGGLAFRFD